MAPYRAVSGLRLLLIVGGLEGCRYLLLQFGAPLPPLWVFLPVQLALALVLFRLLAGIRLVDLGCRSWRDWNHTETSYFIQQLLILNVVYPVVFAQQLLRIVTDSSAVAVLWTGFVPYFFYGFYQEVAYRGVVQTELIRRWGGVVGILASNTLYTFGPLHSNYFSSPASTAVPMFGGIFTIGLYLALVYQRSGNLWIVAIFHGVANAYIVGSGTGLG